MARFSAYWDDLDEEQLNLAKLITAATEWLGGRGKASKIAKVSAATLDNYRSGKTQPKALELLRIVDEQDRVIKDLKLETLKELHDKQYELGKKLQSSRKAMTKSLDSVIASNQNTNGKNIESELVHLPRFDIQASAGAGSLVSSNQPNGVFAVDRDWLSRYVSRSANVGVIEASGDSMLPTITNRDLLLVDVKEGATVEEIMRGGIYVLTLDGGLVVKRLEIDGNELVIISDNPAYPQVRISFAQIENRVIIHGVVFWSGGALETHR